VKEIEKGLNEKNKNVPKRKNLSVNTNPNEFLISPGRSNTRTNKSTVIFSLY
jgi:hypothetical protein